MIKKIKNTLLWYYIIRFFIFPVYDLIWTNLINFKARFFYFLWFRRKRKYIDLKKNDGVLKVEESKIFNEISKNVLVACNKQILTAAENEINTHSDKNYNQSNNMENRYMTEIYDFLDFETKKKSLILHHLNL